MGYSPERLELARIALDIKEYTKSDGIDLEAEQAA